VLDRRAFVMAAAGAAGALGAAGGQAAAATGAGGDPAVPATAPSSPRRSTRLAQWRFHLGHAADMARDFGYGRDQRTFAKAGTGTADAAQPGFDDSVWQAVQVPHDWAAALPFAAPVSAVAKDREDAAAAHGFKAIGRDWPGNSIGWYRTAIAVEPGDRDRILTLHFDGVFRDCVVFVNGYIVGTSASGYAPFLVEIGDFLDYDGGPNVVTLRVDATLGEGWFYEGAGIYRHVDLVRTAPVHVAPWGSAVRTEASATGARVAVRLDLANRARTAATLMVRHHVIGPDGERVAALPDQALTLTLAAGGEAVAEAMVDLSAPRLWSPASPSLYRLVSELLVDGALVDRYETVFGIRFLRFDAARGFLLNGQPTKLLGTCNHQDHAGVGTGIPDALHRWRIAQVQEMGGNAWRSAHNPPATALLDLADAMGMMMIVEMRRNSSDPEAMGELERIVRRDRNHPCVIAWSLGNEEPQQGTARGARITTVMQDRVRALDPTRPTTFAFDHSWDQGTAKVVDVVGFNYRTDRIEAFHQAHPTVPVYGSETGSTVATRGAYANDPAAHVVRAYDTEHPWWASTAEAWWSIAAERPYIAGGFIWTGFDYRGEPTPYPAWPSVSSYFGVMDLCGFPKDDFYYYRAWWRPDRPLVHLLPHWTWPGKEGQPIEVWVHGNCAEVELLLNGRSLGRKAMPRNRHLVWQVPYQPGRIEARGYDHGRITARDERRTAGVAAALRLTSNRTRLVANGTDIAMLMAEVVDARGTPVPDGAAAIDFTVAGDGRIIGVGNGDPTSHEPDVATRRTSFHALAQAILRTGTTPGGVRVTARAEGLRPATVQLFAHQA